MNARQDWADTVERPYLRQQDAEARERDEFEVELERATKTIRSAFERAWTTEGVMLPCVTTEGVKWDTPLGMVVADAVNVPDEENPPALRALRAGDLVQFRAAVVDAYVELQADLMAHLAMEHLQ